MASFTIFSQCFSRVCGVFILLMVLLMEWRGCKFTGRTLWVSFNAEYSDSGCCFRYLVLSRLGTKDHVAAHYSCAGFTCMLGLPCTRVVPHRTVRRRNVFKLVCA